MKSLKLIAKTRTYITKLLLMVMLLSVSLLATACATSGNNDYFFDEKWYKEYSTFKNPDTGVVLEISWDDNDYISVSLNGFHHASYAPKYRKTNDGGYVYSVAGDDENQITYYPHNGNYIEFRFGGITTCYYSSTETKKEEEDSIKYVTDTISGNDLNVHVWFAHTEKEYGNLYVKVLCDISNYSGDELVFDAANYFTLNNNGIIKSGYCEYDYSRMAKDTTITTWVKFVYPESANTDLKVMTMSIDGNDVFLSDKPQDEETLKNITGFYYLENNERFKIVIEQLFDGSYQMITYNPIFGTQTYTFNINSDNSFICDGRKYWWSPESYSITDPAAGQTYYK